MAFGTTIAGLGGKVPEAVGGIKGMAGGIGGLLAKGQDFLAKPAGAGGGGMFAMWLLSKLLQTGSEMGERSIQRASLQSQAEMVTPENLYYQAAQPQAAEEESMARQALFAQLSGGVLGPQLAKGEYSIGG